MWLRRGAALASVIVATAVLGCGDDEATDSSPAATDEEQALEVVREYLQAGADQDWAAVCETMAEAEQEEFERELGSCGLMAKVIFGSPEAQRFGEAAAEIEPESIEISGDSAVVELPFGKFHVTRDGEAWKLYVPQGLELDLPKEEPTESFQRLADNAPRCEAEQPEPFEDPGAALRLGRPTGARAGQAATMQIAFAGQGAEIDAWQVESKHRILGLVLAAPGAGGEGLGGFVREVERGGGEAHRATIAGHAAAIGTTPGSASAATTSGCYGVFAFARDDATLRFLVGRLVVRG